MKKFTLCSILIGCFLFSTGQNVDLKPSGLSYNYNSTTGTISNIKFNIENNNTFGFPLVHANFASKLILVGTGGDEIVIQTIDHQLVTIQQGQTYNVDAGDINLNEVQGLKKGSYDLAVEVDAHNEVEEENEGNNYKILSTNKLTFTPSGPDLTLHSQNWTLSSNNELVISYQLKNLGNVQAENVKIKYLLSIDKSSATTNDNFFLLDADVSILEAGQIKGPYTSSIFLKNVNNLPSGSYYLLMLVDPDNTINETDEDNNNFVSTPDKVVYSVIGIESFAENVGELGQIYPNPFTSNAQIKVHLIQPTVINAMVYDISGRKVAGIIDNMKFSAGIHNLPINNDDLKLVRGTYYCQFAFDGIIHTKKFIIN